VQERGTIPLGRRFGRCRFEVGSTPKLRTMYAIRPGRHHGQTLTRRDPQQENQDEICVKDRLCGIEIGITPVAVCVSSNVMSPCAETRNDSIPPAQHAAHHHHANGIPSCKRNKRNKLPCTSRGSKKKKQTWSESGSHGLPYLKPGPVDA
jgi:hypothetical protein